MCFDFRQEKMTFRFFRKSGAAMGSTYLPFQWVPGGKAAVHQNNQSPPPTFAVQNEWRWKSDLFYAFKEVKYGEVRLWTGHEGPEDEYSCSSSISLNSALDGRGAVNAMPRPLYPLEWPGTHCIGGGVGLTAGLDGCGKFRPQWNSIPGPSNP